MCDQKTHHSLYTTPTMKHSGTKACKRLLEGRSKNKNTHHSFCFYLLKYLSALKYLHIFIYFTTLRCLVLVCHLQYREIHLNVWLDCKKCGKLHWIIQVYTPSSCVGYLLLGVRSWLPK